eukprot:g4318.t1
MSTGDRSKELDRKVSHRTQAIRRLESEMSDMLGEKKLAACVEMLSVEEREELSRQFRLFDEDKSGIVSRKELEHVLKDLEVFKTEEALRDCLDNMFSLFDKSNDNAIDENEFMQMMAYSMKIPLSESELEESFSQFDTNKDGTVDIAELKKALVSIGPKFLSPEECDDFLSSVDKDKDGQVEASEFVSYFLRKDLGGASKKGK